MFSLMSVLAIVCVLVAIHEYGHLVAARMVGVKVHEFAVGMGPVLFERTDRNGMQWSLRAIPLGGYVMPDEEEMGEISPIRQVIIAVAGPVASILAALPFFWVMFMIRGNVAEASVTHIVWHSCTMAVEYMQSILVAIPDLYVRLFTGGVSLSDLSGPVGIVDVGSEHVHQWTSALWFAGILSINLGAFNMLPFVPLDGGRVLMALTQEALGRSIRERVERVLGSASAVFILVMLVVITYYDILDLL